MSDTKGEQAQQASEAEWPTITTWIKPPKPVRRCPKCGNTNLAWGELQIHSGKDILGRWCLKCLADLLDQHVPRMQPIEQEGS